MPLSRETYLAVKRQSTANVAVVPTHFLRFKEGDLEKQVENIVNNPIQNNRWGALNVVQGKQTCEGTYKFDVDANECVHIFAGTLGTLVTADISSGTDSSAFSHTCTIASSLPNFSWEQAKGALTDTSNNRLNYRIMRGYGVQLDSFTLRGSDGLLELETKLIALGIFDMARHINDAAAGSSVAITLDQVEGLVSGETVNNYDDTPQNETDAIASLSLTNKTITIGTLGNSYTVANRGRTMLTPLSPSYSVAAQVMAFSHVNFQFGATVSGAGSAAEENIENWELTYMNNLEARYGSIRASAGVIAPKAASCKLKFTKYFESRADADRYFLAQRRACVLTITNGVLISATDSNLHKYTITFNLSDLRFTSHEMPTGTDELFAYDIEAEAFYDTSDARALQIVVKNASAGTVYTA